jgi:hypothetical protein
MFRSIYDGVREYPEAADSDTGEVRVVFSVLLRELAAAVQRRPDTWVSSLGGIPASSARQRTGHRSPEAGHAISVGLAGSGA